MTRDPRRAFHVVDAFEQELCDYTGAPMAVALDSCTNALFLTLRYEYDRITKEARQDGRPFVIVPLEIPKRTYVGVLQAAKNAGWLVKFTDENWQSFGMYSLRPTRVVDAARRLHRGVWDAAVLEDGHRRVPPITCLSFHASKQLPLGRGGAVLTSDEELDAWLRRARADGRAEGLDAAVPMFPGWHCYMPPPTAALGLWILTTLDDVPNPKPLYYDPDLSELE